MAGGAVITALLFSSAFDLSALANFIKPRAVRAMRDLFNLDQSVGRGGGVRHTASDLTLFAREQREFSRFLLTRLSVASEANRPQRGLIKGKE